MMSIGMPLSVSSMLRNDQTGVDHWLHQFSESVQARRKTMTFLQPQELVSQIGQTDSFLAARGFLRESSSTFFCASGRICFYPLVLKQARVQLNDLLIPVFNRQADGSWKRLVVLTGYQVEALSRAANALAGLDIPLHEILLPAGAIAADGSKFITSRGEVSVKTQIKDGFAQTDITVRGDQKTLFSDSFRSQHTLRSTLNGNT